MPSWWGKSSSKEVKKKTNKESFMDTLHRKFKTPTEEKGTVRTGGSRRRNSDIVSERGSRSRAASRSPSPSSQVSRCQSFAERTQAQPLPLPVGSSAKVGRTDSALSVQRPGREKSSKTSLFPLQNPVVFRTGLMLLMLMEIWPLLQFLVLHLLRVRIHPTLVFLAPRQLLLPIALQEGLVEQVASSAAFWAGKPYEAAHLGSGHCSSQPECSPIPSPRMTSPGPSSQIHSNAQQSHRLPLPPSNSSPFSPSSSAAGSSSVPREVLEGQRRRYPQDRWKKGKLLGRGTFGHVYVGFNRESGEMCAMKEVTLFADDAKSRESAKQLGQEIILLSRLRHPNIVQYYGTETVDDRLYIYLEYVSGGSIYKLLQDYGQFGELVIRSYTQQILSGLAYLHAKNTVHRDIKGANILVDPNGRVKLADFGMAKHITGQSCPLSFKGSPYWMAPEVIKNSSGCNLAVDIWSLGCTVLEMATTKPPWSTYEGVAAMFKIGNSKELPAIPDHLSEEGKEFVKLCLQRNPLHRPTAAQLLEHPFVKNAAPVERPIVGPEPLESPGVTNGMRSLGVAHARNLSSLDSEGLGPGSGVHQYRGVKTFPTSSDSQMLKNLSCPVSPIGSPLLHGRSSQHMNGRMSPSPISSPRTTSGSSTPLTGGNGAIPFHHLKQGYSHEGFSISRSPNCHYGNGSTYHDTKPDLFRGLQPSSHGFRELMASDNEVRGKQFGRPAHEHQRELYDVQTVLADRVSQQLLRDQIKLNPSLDLNPGSPMLGRSNGM
ncbi:hypothetical protein MKW92_004941 [Papaver armeniacum]|nr:hypothetical protein MKW92_004941 [Papaver armeniacum]